MITKKQAKLLAVSYRSFIQAIDEDDSLGVIVWGPILQRTQDETGVALLNNIKSCVKSHHVVLRTQDNTTELKRGIDN
jgi:hypothetical protein